MAKRRSEDDAKREAELKKLGREINKGHRQLLKAVRTTVEKAREVGQQLLAAKKLVRKGRWLPWVEDNCDFTHQDAQRYMRIAEAWNMLEREGVDVSSCTLTEALDLIALLRGTKKGQGRAIAKDGLFCLPKDDFELRLSEAKQLRDDRLTFEADSTELQAVTRLVKQLIGGIRRTAVKFANGEKAKTPIDAVSVAIVFAEEVSNRLADQQVVEFAEETTLEEVETTDAAAMAAEPGDTTLLPATQHQTNGQLAS